MPPNCKPECEVSSECAQNKACINKKCVDPCPGTCGENAFCKVVNHNPICSCARGFTGDPFTGCIREESKNTINFSNLFSFFLMAIQLNKFESKIVISLFP